MEKCGEGVIDAASDVIVLGFELLDSSVERSPQMIIDMFKQGDIQKAIQKALASEGKRLAELQRANKSIGNDVGVKVFSAIGKSVGFSAQKAAKKKIERSSDYKAVENSLKELECRFKESPTGVFIDEHKGLVIVVASGIAIGGVTAMYAAKSGDWVASQLASLASKQLRFKVLGNVELGAKKIVFKPSERKVELTTLTVAKWKTVKASLDLHVAFKDDNFAKSSASSEVVVDVAKGAQLAGKGSVGYVRSLKPGEQHLTYDLRLGMTFSDNGPNSKLKLQVLGYVNQDPGKRTIGGSGKVTYGITGGGGKAPAMNLILDARGGRSEIFQPTGANKVQNTFETKLGLELTF